MMQLLTGIAGSGKTSQCLQRYRDQLRQSGGRGVIGQQLWLTPTHRSAQMVLANLLEDDLTCCWAPGVMTFEQFAERVLRGAGQAASLLNPSQRRMLVQSVIDDALAAGELQYFRKIAATQGFVNQLGRFIVELKREETWPQAWQEMVADSDGRVKDRELGQLYERYQQRLLEWDKYDAEGRFWLARTELSQGNWQAFPRLSLVVVDGFTDFTSTQQEMLVLLAKHVDHLLVTLPGESDPRRHDLFSKSTRTAQKLAASVKAAGVHVTHADFIAEPQAATAAKTPAGLQHVSNHLFESIRETVPSKQSTGVDMFSALGPRAEIREVARRVKMLLLDGVPAQQILVVTRDAKAYTPLIESIWPDAGIPYAFPQSRPMTSVPLAKAFSVLYEVLIEDWSFASLKKLLRHTPLQISGLNDQRQALKSGLWMLRRLNLRGGRDEILETLKAVALQTNPEDTTSSEQHEQETGPLEPMQAAARQASYLFEQLNAALRQLTKPGSYSEHTQRLLAIARELFLSATDPSEQGSTAVSEPSHSGLGMVADQWNLVAGLLRQAAEFQDQLNRQDAKPTQWRQFATWLEDQFHTQTLPPDSAEPGDVLILDTGQARHLRVKHLFVLGLQEGTFPGGADHQPFYGEQERQAFHDQGIELTVRGSHFLDEMQLFYQLVTRAQQQLTLSYSRVTATGGPQYPAAFYQQFKTLFTPTALVEQAVGQLSPVPENRDLLTVSDWRLQAVLDIQHGDAGLLSWWATQPQWTQGLFSLQAAATMNAHRFEHRGFTEFEGMLQSPLNRQSLLSAYPSQYTFSASRLERYAGCPFRYFADAVLDIEPIDVPRLQTDYRRRGNLIHDLLAELHAQSGLDFSEEETKTQLGELSKSFLDLLQARFKNRFTRSSLQAALDGIEQTLLSEWGELYAQQSADYSKRIAGGWEQPPTARYRELSFGTGSTSQDQPAPNQDTSAEIAKTQGRVEFGGAAGKVRVEGRIDRIDVGQVDGQTVYAVIDYKTGSPPTVRDAAVSRGTQLQLALYTVAIARMNLLGPDAVPWAVGYWGIKEQGFAPQFKKAGKKGYEPLPDDFLSFWNEELDRLLPRIVDSLRAGEFPVQNDDPQCVSRCPYRMACRVNQVRAVAQPLQKLWSLQTDKQS